MTAARPEIEIHILYTPDTRNPGVAVAETLVLAGTELPESAKGLAPEAAFQVERSIRRLIEKAR